MLAMLLQCVTLDNWNGLMGDVALAQPHCTANDVLNDCGDPIIARVYFYRCRLLGSRAFNGGGGSGKGAPLAGLLISYYEVWCQRRRKNLLSIRNGQFFFSPNICQMMTFLSPLDALIPKSPFSFFCGIFGSGSPPRPGGQSRSEFGGPVN